MASRTKTRLRAVSVDRELLAVKRQLASALRKRIAVEKISLAGLARRLGTGRTALRRVLDERNTSCTLRTMFATATGLGLRLRLIAEPWPTEKLMKVAEKMVDEDNQKRADRLEQEFVEGFYGHAPDPTRQHPTRAIAAPVASRAGTRHNAR